jgi:hypothetical protein
MFALNIQKQCRVTIIFVQLPFCIVVVDASKASTWLAESQCSAGPRDWFKDEHGQP